jgi:hypothetical protein
MNDPLHDDLAGVPEELRASYQVLRDTHMLPVELERSLLRIDDLIAACDDDNELRELRIRRNSTALRFSMLMERRDYDRVHAEYAERVARRFSEP